MKCRDKSATRLSRCPEVIFRVKKTGVFTKKTHNEANSKALSTQGHRDDQWQAHHIILDPGHQGHDHFLIIWVAIRDQGDQGGHAQLITSILDQVHD